MGFYSNYTLVEDARRHGITVYPVHPNHSEWDCTILRRPGKKQGEIQLGWKIVRGLGEEEGRTLVEERKQRPFSGLSDFLARTRIKRDLLYQLAIGDAFRSWQLDQRQALWAILDYDLAARGEPGGQLDLWAAAQPKFSGENASAVGENVKAIFATMSDYDQIRSDYSTYGLSTRGHPMQALRRRAPSLPQLTSKKVRELPNGTRTRFSGMVIVRQRPSTAGGTPFATLEDEHGLLDLILRKEIHEKTRGLFDEHSFFTVHGQVQRDGYSVSISVDRLEPVLLDEAEFHSRSYY